MPVLKKITIIILLLGSTFSFSQVYNFIHYSVENGFPQANADWIMQDNLGYIWFATQVGAVRFDGKEYKIYNNRDGLPSHIISEIYQDYKNRIWIGTKEGLSVYNYDSIQTFIVSDTAYNNTVQHIWEDSKKKIWIKFKKGLYSYNNKDLSKQKLPNKISSINAHFYYKDNLYIATNEGIYIQTDGGFRPYLPKILPQTRINDLVWKRDTLYMATLKMGLYIYSPDGKIVHYGKSSFFESSVIDQVLLASSGDIYFGTEGKGVFRYCNGEFQQMTSKNGMYNTSVLYLMEDYENNIWIGGRNGVVMYNPGNPFTHYPEANSGNKESVFGMIQDSYNHVWFTTYGNGISKFDGTSWKYFNENDGTIDNRFFSVIEDYKKNLWFASANYGLIKYNRQKFIQYDSTNGFCNSRVFKVFTDSKNNIWSCTQGSGIAKYDGLKFQFYSTKEGLPGMDVMCGIEDTLGNYYFGFIGNGLCYFDGAKFDKLEFNIKDEPEYIRSLAKDPKGNIYCGSATMGIFQIIKKSNNKIKCLNITEKDGLNSNNIYFVFYDSHNNLWAGTEKGINRIILDQDRNKILHIYNYSKQEGFIGVETSINGAMEDKDRMVWFATNAGATKYDFRYDQRNVKEPKVYVNNIRLFYENTDWKTFSDSLNAFKIPANLILKHTQNHLTFEYTGISFTSPKKTVYRYKLSGFEESWSPITKKREAVYTNIPPGDYTFLVKAQNNDGIWSHEPAQFSFTIKPPYYKTNWFYLLVTLLAGIMFFAYVRIRIFYLNKAKKTLERKVIERTTEIQLQKIEIQEKNEELNQRSEEVAAQRDEIESQRDTVTRQKEQIENLFQVQTNSIKYARHIQKAVLPKQESFKELFKDHFIFFRPHSIVSGDFYFSAKIKNWKILAAVDSTGHGVPGGFMSMLGISFLNEIVYSIETISTDIILNKLREYIIRSLKQKGTPGEQKEGMDVAILAIDTTEMIVQFSGANRPVLLIRRDEYPTPEKDNLKFLSNKTQGISIYEMIPDKMPVAVYPKMKPFTKTVFELHPNDQLYLFSDGYQDQTGGKESKRLSKKTFYQTIYENANLPMTSQKIHIIERLSLWMDKHDQIDDILVIGIKV